MAGVREVQGADRHHLAGRAHRRQRRGARLGRRGAARHHQQLLRAQGDREGRRRPDRGGRGCRRPCRREEPVRAGAGDPRSGSTARSRCRGAIATGGAVLAAQAMGADFAYIGSAFIATEEARAADAYKQAIVDGNSRRHRLQQPVHRRARQLPEGRRSARPGSTRTTCPRATRAQMNFGGDGASKAWKDIWGCGQGIGAVDRVVPAARAGRAAGAPNTRHAPARRALDRRSGVTVSFGDDGVRGAVLQCRTT